MNPKQRARLLLVLVALVCGAAVWGVIWYRSRPLSLQDRYRKLPLRDAVVLYVDFRALQSAGLLGMLTGSQVAQDPEYKLFVQKTEFDYTADLDSAIVSFAPAGKYLLLNGRFQWKKLRDYAVSEGGSCFTARCSMPGSTADRRISFLPLQKNVMAMAVSPDPDAVRSLLYNEAPVPDPALPDAPVWLRIPGSVLRSGGNFPSGTQMFARTMEKAKSVTVAFMPDGARLAARLEVVCQDPGDAASIASDLTKATDLLRQMIEREHHEPNSSDLSGVLTSGSFRNEGSKVVGYWPIEQSFVANVLSGGVN